MRQTKLVKLINQLNEEAKNLSGEEQWQLVADIADILAGYPLYLYPMRGADAFPKSRQLSLSQQNAILGR